MKTKLLLTAILIFFVLTAEDCDDCGCSMSSSRVKEWSDKRFKELKTLRESEKDSLLVMLMFDAGHMEYENRQMKGMKQRFYGKPEHIKKMQNRKKSKNVL
jgi:hypothetical protein